jgi:hypothetical protein
MTSLPPLNLTTISLPCSSPNLMSDYLGILMVKPKLAILPYNFGINIISFDI